MRVGQRSAPPLCHHRFAFVGAGVPRRSKIARMLEEPTLPGRLLARSVWKQQDWSHIPPLRRRREQCSRSARRYVPAQVTIEAVDLRDMLFRLSVEALAIVRPTGLLPPCFAPVRRKSRRICLHAFESSGMRQAPKLTEARLAL